jgi:hypothetical protein
MQSRIAFKHFSVTHPSEKRNLIHWGMIVLRGLKRIAQNCWNMLFRKSRHPLSCLKILNEQRSESTRTQLQAFTNIVTLITRYPGLRRIILNSKAIRHVVESGVAISRLWNPSGDHRDSQWKFYCEFASACITDKDISTFVEGFSTSDLSGSVDQQGLTVIETLLVAVDSQ